MFITHITADLALSLSIASGFFGVFILGAFDQKFSLVVNYQCNQENKVYSMFDFFS